MYFKSLLIFQLLQLSYQEENGAPSNALNVTTEKPATEKPATERSATEKPDTELSFGRKLLDKAMCMFFFVVPSRKGNSLDELILSDEPSNIKFEDISQYFQDFYAAAKNFVQEMESPKKKGEDLLKLFKITVNVLKSYSKVKKIKKTFKASNEEIRFKIICMALTIAIIFAAFMLGNLLYKEFIKHKSKYSYDYMINAFSFSLITLRIAVGPSEEARYMYTILGLLTLFFIIYSTANLIVELIKSTFKHQDENKNVRRFILKMFSLLLLITLQVFDLLSIYTIFITIYSVTFSINEIFSFIQGKSADVESKGDNSKDTSTNKSIK